MHLGATEEIKTGLAGQIQKLRAKAQEFNAAYAAISRSPPDPEKFPAQYKKWAELKAYGDKTRNSISWITSTIDKAGNVIDSITYGVTHPFGLNPFGLNGLGFLPLVPMAGMAVTGAVITSAIAAMTYFVTQAYEYGKFADATPEVRAELQKRAASAGGLSSILSSVQGILIVGALIYFAPKLLAMVKK